jgi:hypothetical protein
LLFQLATGATDEHDSSFCPSCLLIGGGQTALMKIFLMARNELWTWKKEVHLAWDGGV